MYTSSSTPQLITIRGGSFASGARVTLTSPSGASAFSQVQTVSRSRTEIKVRATIIPGPSGASGYVLKVVNPDGHESNRLGAQFLGPFAPTVTSVSPPASGSTPLTHGINQITIFGNAFEIGLTATITAPDNTTLTVPASEIQVKDTREFLLNLDLTNGPTSTGGFYKIRVNNPDGRQSSVYGFLGWWWP